MRGQQGRLSVLLRLDRRADAGPAPAPADSAAGVSGLDRFNPTFCKLYYASEGLPSVPTVQLLLEQLHCNLLFRWFVGLSPDGPDRAFHHIHQE